MAERRVLVVGGGLAGVAAALSAAARGAHVSLVWRAPGATSLYSGAMQMAAPPDALAGLPEHPLNRLDLDGASLASELDEAVSDLTRVLAEAGLPLREAPGGRGLYADLHGRAWEARLVPAEVAPGELASLRGRHVAVVGIPQVAEYEAEATAAALGEAGVEAEAVAVEIEDLGPGASITDLFGLPAPRPDVRAAAVAYPPGFKELPADGFELLATAPSPHGWRLQQALERALAAAAVDVIRGEVESFTADGRRLTAAHVRDETLPADAFVLATGRFIGGGLRKERRVREPLLDLPVFFGGLPLEERALELRHLEYLSPGPAFRTGLQTDGQLRPLDRAGRPAYENLRAAGAVLGGRDYDDGFGFGVPLLTGRLAGRWSAES